jgi:hypothetical protein
MYQAYISRQQLKMGAWPYVTQGNTGADGYARLVENVGLGPALVRSMRVDVEGKPVRDWRGLLTRALAVDSARFAALVQGVTFTTPSVRRGMVLLPGRATEIVRVGPGDLALTLRRVLNDPRVRVRVCYCSLYDDCWVSDSRADEPAAVERCAADPALEFES